LDPQNRHFVLLLSVFSAYLNGLLFRIVPNLREPIPKGAIALVQIPEAIPNYKRVARFVSTTTESLGVLGAQLITGC
jgi:hypothetical protein